MLVALVGLGVTIDRLAEHLGLGLDAAAPRCHAERERERERESAQEVEPTGRWSPGTGLHSSSHEDDRTYHRARRPAIAPL